jgi:hypothetical protein
MSEVQTQAAKPNGTAVVVQDDIGAVMERVMISGDLSPLPATQRSEYYTRVCQSVGLNPLTQPFAYIKLNGKLTLYALRSCTDQLRQIHKISIEIVDRKLTDGFLSVHVRATNKDGRRDEDYGVIPVSGTLSGEAGANLMMKCVTKAKRRVTLSICGLGMLDETEVSALAGAEIVDVEGRTVATVEAPLPAPKRKSSAEGKRNTGDVKKFNELRAALENAEGAIPCQQAWNDHAEFLSTVARGWYETLKEAYVVSMQGFGVEIDPDTLEQTLQAAE